MKRRSCFGLLALMTHSLAYGPCMVMQLTLYKNFQSSALATELPGQGTALQQD
jgi:hypothetical protein